MMPSTWCYSNARHKIRAPVATSLQEAGGDVAAGGRWRRRCRRPVATALQEAGGDRDYAVRIMMGRFHAEGDAPRQRRQAAYIIAITEALNELTGQPNEPAGMTSTLRLAFQSRARSG